MHESPSAREPGGATGTFLLSALLLVVAPLFRGGNRPLIQMFLELIALVLAAMLFARPSFKAHLSVPFLAALLLLILYPLVYLIPLPDNWWVVLQGRDFYAQLFEGFDFRGVDSLRPLSLITFETEYSWLALFPSVIIFLAVVGQHTSKLRTLVTVFLGVVTLQALLGLIQYGDGVDSFFRFGMSQDNSANGTYPNRDHFAGLLEMALPIALALLAATVGPLQKTIQHKRLGLNRRIVTFFRGRGNHVFVYAAITIVVLLGLIFSRSRTGIALAMLGIFLSAILYSRRLGGANVFGLVGTIVTIGLALAAEIGLWPVLNRFTVSNPADDLRWPIYDAILPAIGSFFPWGSGPGTFPSIFLRFQTGDLPGFINHAHNDYLEWLMEGGFIVAVLLVLFTVFYVRQWFHVWVKGRWSTFRFAQAGAGVGLLLMSLHGFVDFNLHIPANAIYFAFLAGLFFHHQMEYPKQIVSGSMVSAEKPVIPLSKPKEIPPENLLNPFAD
jgi:O-antigen ligase